MEEEDGEFGNFNNVKIMDTLCLGFSYFCNSLRRRSWRFFQTNRGFKDGLVYVLLECFHNFCLIPIINHYCGS